MVWQTNHSLTKIEQILTLKGSGTDLPNQISSIPNKDPKGLEFCLIITFGCEWTKGHQNPNVKNAHIHNPIQLGFLFVFFCDYEPAEIMVEQDFEC